MTLLESIGSRIQDSFFVGRLWTSLKFFRRDFGRQSLAKVLVVLLCSAAYVPDSWAEKKAIKANQSVSDIEYGELFFLETKEAGYPTVSIMGGGGFVFSNPYYQSLYGDLTAQFYLSRFVMIGPQARFFKNTKSSLTESIEEELAGFSFEQTIMVPKQSFFLRTTIIPFAGHVSFFGFNSFPVELQLSLAPGWSFYNLDQNAFSAQWSGGFNVGLPQSLFFHFEIGQVFSFGLIEAQDTLATLGLGVTL